MVDPTYFLPGIGPVKALGDALGLTDDIPNVADLAKKDKHRRLSQVLAGGGFTGNDLVVARQVSIAESGGRATATGDGGTLGYKGTGKPTSIGLMQVRGFDEKGAAVHAGKAGSPTTYDAYVTWAKDPDNNAKLAYAVFQSGGWGQWTTYTNGRYKLSGNRDPLITTKQSLGVSDVPVVGDAVGAAGDVAGAVTDIVGTLLSRDTWFRIGKGVVGLELITLGFVGLVIIALKEPIKAASRGAVRAGGKSVVGKVAKGAATTAGQSVA